MLTLSIAATLKMASRSQTFDNTDYANVKIWVFLFKSPCTSLHYHHYLTENQSKYKCLEETWLCLLLHQVSECMLLFHHYYHMAQWLHYIYNDNTDTTIYSAATETQPGVASVDLSRVHANLCHLNYTTTTQHYLYTVIYVCRRCQFSCICSARSQRSNGSTLICSHLSQY